MEDNFQEEVECLRNIVECLDSGLKTITSYVNAAPEQQQEQDGDGNTINEQMFASTALQVIELFDLAIALLSSDPSPYRIQLVVFDYNPEFLSTLLAFVAVTINNNTKLEGRSNTSSNNNNSPRGRAGRNGSEDAMATLADVKIAALKSVTKFVSMCSDSKGQFDEESMEYLCKQCTECIVQEQGVEVLLQALETETDENVKLAVVETLFVFIMRNEVGKLAIVVQRGLPVLMKCISNETLPMIRNYVCAILREFSSLYPEELLKEGFIDMATELINIDPSPDVRALCAEALEVIIRNDPRVLSSLVRINNDENNSNNNNKENSDDTDEKREAPSISNLAQVLKNRLDKDFNNDVLEATCKLLETLFYIRDEEFIDKFIDISGWSSLINCLKRPTKTASLALRALRFLLQQAKYDKLLGFKIITHFPSLSVLFKYALELDSAKQKNPRKKPEPLSTKLLRVELAICFGIILAQNPACRSRVYNELKPFPLWMSSLRGALLRHLSLAETEYFADINLIDSTGALMENDFDMTLPQSQGVKNVFIAQERRTLNNVLKNEETSGNEAANSPDAADSQHKSRGFTFDFPNMDREQSRGKTNAVIMSYAIHITLSPSGAPMRKIAQQAYGKRASMTDEEVADTTNSEPALYYNVDGDHINSETDAELLSNNNYNNNNNQDNIPANDPATLPMYRKQQHQDSPRTVHINRLLRNNTFDTRFEGEEEGVIASEEEIILQQQYQQHADRKQQWRPASLAIHSPKSPYAAAPGGHGHCSGPNSPREFMGSSPRSVRPPDITKKPGFKRAFYLPLRFAHFYEKEDLLAATRRWPPTSPRVNSRLVLPKPNFIPYEFEMKPIYNRANLKVWNEKDIQEGDLFDFEIPFESISLDAIQKVINKCKKHSVQIKKLMLVSPQAATKNTTGKGRRSFLYDLFHNIMPGIQRTLEQLYSLAQQHGIDEIKVPLYVFAGQQQHSNSSNSKSSNNNSITSYSSGGGEKIIHGANILDIVEAVKLYFAQQTATSGSAADSSMPSASSVSAAAAILHQPQPQPQQQQPIITTGNENLMKYHNLQRQARNHFEQQAAKEQQQQQQQQKAEAGNNNDKNATTEEEMGKAAEVVAETAAAGEAEQ